MVAPDGTYPEPPGAEPAGRSDPLGTVALVLGCVGILVAGIVATIVVAVLAAITGARAREQGRSLEDAYLAFGLAAVDGVVWLVLHMLFDIPFLLG